MTGSWDDQTAADLVRRYLDLSARIETQSEERDSIKVRLRLLGVGKHDTGAGVVTVTPQRRFDADLAADVLRTINPDLVATCSISKVESGLVKKVVGDDVYDRCKKPVGDHKVSVA